MSGLIISSKLKLDDEGSLEYHVDAEVMQNSTYT